MTIAPSVAPIDSLTGYIDRIKQLRKYWKIDKETRYGEIESVWFRGHEREDWKLTPKLYRSEYRGASEAEIRQGFQIRAQQLLQGSRQPTDKWEWYFLMQHYGVPTRLLEVEPYLPDLERAFEGKKIRMRSPAAIDPPHVDRRLAAQGSHFVIFGADCDLTHVKAARSKRDRVQQIAKIVIRRKAAPQIRADLDLCGITRSLLFPDLQALCDDISHKCRQS